jgi:hypothetical protein
MTMVWAFHFQNGPWVFTLDKHSFKYTTNLNSCMWTCFNEEKTPLITKEKQKKEQKCYYSCSSLGIGFVSRK